MLKYLFLPILQCISHFKLTIVTTKLLKWGEKKKQKQKPSDKHESSIRRAKASRFPQRTVPPSQKWVWFAFFFLLLLNSHLFTLKRSIILSVSVSLCQCKFPVATGSTKGGLHDTCSKLQKSFKAETAFV